MKNDKAILLDISTAAHLVVDFIQGITEQEFRKDLKTQSAVLHQLVIIGEAVKRLSSQFRQEHSEIPWKEIAGMRDRLIHGYDLVNLKRVWQTAVIDVPVLLHKIDPLLPNK